LFEKIKRENHIFFKVLKNCAAYRKFYYVKIVKNTKTPLQEGKKSCII
jgi:hypothetical protein